MFPKLHPPTHEPMNRRTQFHPALAIWPVPSSKQDHTVKAAGFNPHSSFDESGLKCFSESLFKAARALHQVGGRSTQAVSNSAFEKWCKAVPMILLQLKQKNWGCLKAVLWSAFWSIHPTLLPKEKWVAASDSTHPLSKWTAAVGLGNLDHPTHCHLLTQRKIGLILFWESRLRSALRHPQHSISAERAVGWLP